MDWEEALVCHFNPIRFCRLSVTPFHKHPRARDDDLGLRGVDAYRVRTRA